jgi:hypothetical protein
VDICTLLGQLLRVTWRNGVTLIVTEGELVNCAPSFIVLATAMGNVTILTNRICRVEVICPPM